MCIGDIDYLEEGISTKSGICISKRTNNSITHPFHVQNATRIGAAKNALARSTKI